MDKEKGTSGLISFQNVRCCSDGWELSRPSHTVLVLCDGDRFMRVFGLNIDSLATVIGMEWQVRCDNEDSLYYGYASCTGISRPARQIRSPSSEYFPNDLSLHFEFRHRSYGPYHVGEGMAMARNGNAVFFDLLPLSEIDQRIAVGDLRFRQKTAT